MINLEDIPNMPNQDDRIEEITVDCYGEHEQLAAFYTYFEDALKSPFEAIWRDADEPGHSETVTVLGVADYDDRRGILLHAKRGEKPRRIVAEQVWAKDKDSTNAIVLGDYRYWINGIGGLDYEHYS